MSGQEALHSDLEAFGLRVAHSETKGRHVIARRDFEPGELVGCFFPLQSAILDNYKKRVCGYCQQWNEEGRFTLCCDQCEAAYFCSEACQRRYLAFSRHADICHLERKLATWKADKDARSLMRLYLKVLHAHGRSAKNGEWNPLAQDPASSFTLGEALSHFGVVLDEEWQERVEDMSARRFTGCDMDEVTPLQSHIEDWTKEDLQDWHKHRTFLKTLQGSVAALTEDPEAGVRLTSAFPEAGILPLVSAFESNNFGIWSAKGEVLGRSVYPRASYFNHSCDPNCYSERKGPVLFVVADAEIRQGNELTISYIDTNQPRSARQTFLKQHYHFACQCQRCEAESVAGGKVKVTYAKSKNHTQKSKIPKKKALWKDRDPLVGPTLADEIAKVTIYDPLPIVLQPQEASNSGGKD